MVILWFPEREPPRFPELWERGGPPIVPWIAADTTGPSCAG